jgi:tRNA G10  N-methylase Trm11
MSNYIFLLGSNPTLSLAEIKAKFHRPHITILSEKAALLKLDNSIENPQAILNSMGGTIRIAEFIKNYPLQNPSEILFDLLSNEFSDIKDIGISYYNFNQNLSKTLIQTKKNLRKSGLNKRFIFENNQPELKAATLKRNKLINKGIELLLIKTDQNIAIGKTIAIQDVDQYSLRDYGKPKPDTISGMLPPKLSQMMLSLACIEPGHTVYDPFCGSGVVLQEALMQKMNIIGSDISEKAIIHTRENLKWLIKQFHLEIPDYRHLVEKDIFQADATYYQLEHPVDAIVTEPYLGPGHSHTPTDEFAIQILNNIRPIYEKFLKSSTKNIKKDGFLVFVIPVIKTDTRKHSIDIKSLLDSPLKEEYNLIQFDNSDLIYEQPGQKVLRKIIVLQKI